MPRDRANSGRPVAEQRVNGDLPLLSLDYPGTANAVVRGSYIVTVGN